VLYRFNSRATAPFVMLEAHGRQVLGAIGKEDAREGIVTVDQMPAAIAALEAAMEREALDAPAGDGEETAEDQPRRIGIRQRGVPLLRMLKDSLARRKDVTWEAR
jgi:hypothetical protein